MRLWLACVVLIATCALTAADDPWQKVDKILSDAVTSQVFPGCVAFVGDRNGQRYAKAFGSFTYGLLPPFSEGKNPPMELTTRFDMASVTKVLSTTTAVAILYQDGALHLNTPISDPSLLGPAFAANGKGPITVLNCMLHNAGFPPDPNPNWSSKTFGCPEAQKQYPEENFSCREKVFAALLNQTLSYPIGTKYDYSDISMMTMANVVAKVALAKGYVKKTDFLPNCLDGQETEAALYSCAYEAFVRMYIFEPLAMKSSGFLPPQVAWGQCAPTENQTAYPELINRQIQGQVSDGNAFILGGIAGHAGLFTTALDASILMRRWMWADPVPDADPEHFDAVHKRQMSAARARRLAASSHTYSPSFYAFINTTTTSLFIKQYDHSLSSRAIGWNTNDPTVYDMGWNVSCGAMSAATFMHTGYTGTEVCGDPQNDFFTILLTNRVYPTDRTGPSRVHDVRYRFGTAVLAAMKQPRRAEGIDQPTDVVF